MLYFDDQGRGAQIRRAWLKVRCGKQGVIKYCAEIGGGGDGRDAVGRFVQEQGREAMPSPVDQPRSSGERAEELLASLRQDWRRAQRSRVLNLAEPSVDSHVDSDLLDDNVDASPEETNPNYTEKVPLSDSSGEDDTMNDLCLKYLDSSYADEIQRLRDPPTPGQDL